MAQRPLTDDELESLAGRIEAWLRRQLDENPVVAAVEKMHGGASAESRPLGAATERSEGESGERRWFVRLHGEQKDVFTIWFHLRQRTLHYETYVMPAPEENHAAFFEHLLRRNLKLYGAAFAIGPEDAVFLTGQLANQSVDDDELDRILGSLYQWVEQFFRPALRIGFASHFARRSASTSSGNDQDPESS